MTLRLSGVEFVGHSDVRAIGTWRAPIDRAEFQHFVRAWFGARLFAMHDNYCGLSCDDVLFMTVADAPNTWVAIESPGYTKKVNECYIDSSTPKPPQQYFDLRQELRQFAKAKGWL
jgi:hypothetical protein